MSKEIVEVSNEFLKFVTNIGHKMIFRTILFGKDYVWMRDTEGTIYLEGLF